MSRQDKRRSSRKYKDSSQASEGSTTRDILEIVVFTLVIFVIFFLIRQFLFVPVSVDGPSMEPTLHDGDRLILNKVEEVERFDVVVFPAPDHSGNQYIKRVIGLPGDTVEYKDSILYVNGQEVYEPYLEEFKALQPNWQAFVEDFTLNEYTESNVVPDGHYFVLGDNRANSKDSRSFGYIQADEVTGTANFRLYPFNNFGNVNDLENYPDIADQAQSASAS